MMHALLMKGRWAYICLAAVAALALLLSACGGGEEEEEEHGEMAMAAGNGATAEAHGGGHDDTAAGVVHPKPEGATEVRVSLAEWTVHAAVSSVASGEIYFLVDNLGPEHPHELVIIRTDLAADALPVIEDGSVPEDAVEIVGEIEEFAPATSASGVFHLEPATYALICNVVEETGNMESHYHEGMRMVLIVE